MKRFIFVIALLFVFGITSLCASAETNTAMLKGDQDYIILGSVKNIEDEFITVTVDHVLGQRASELVGDDIKIEKFIYTYCTNHIPADFCSPIVSDNVVISLDYKEEAYVMKNGAYKVDSNEYASCKIINHSDEYSEECIRALAQITCFIRSDTKVNDFKFDSEGNIFAVYPQSMQQCIQFVDGEGNVVVDDAVEEANPENRVVEAAAPADEGEDNRWIYGILVLALGAVLGVAISYFYSKKKKTGI